MTYQQKEGDIAIFRIKEKKNERGPDWTGKALINGEEKEISLWSKNATMLAGTIRVPRRKDSPKAQTDQVYAPKVPVVEDEDPFGFSEVPF